ncbi:MAG: response regulator, partial [Bacteroidales bacterium]|nr:response regulator [Bacteroidales bacterium]
MSLENKKIRVLIVDDSAVVRQTMSSILQTDPDIEVMGTAGDPYIAAKRIQMEVPDVITLDVEMPRMDGITFLRKIMTQHPIPVLIISSLTEEGSQTALKALEYGAVDVIAKPRMDTKEFIE